MMQFFGIFRVSLLTVICLGFAAPASSAQAQDCTVKGKKPDYTFKQQCRDECNELTEANGCMSKLSDFNGALNSRNTALKIYNEALARVYKAVMDDATHGSNYKQQLKRAREVIKSLKTKITGLIKAGEVASNLVAKPKKLIEAVAGAEDGEAGNDPAFHTDLQKILKEGKDLGSYANDKQTFFDTLDDIKALIEMPTTSGRPNGYKTHGLVDLVPSSVEGKDATNVFDALYNQMTNGPQSQLRALNNENAKVETAKKALNTAAARIKLPSKGQNDGGGGGDRISITRAVFGDRDKVHKAFIRLGDDTNPNDLKDGVCVATGYFKRECEYISVNMDICRNQKDGRLRIVKKGGCSNDNDDTKEDTVGEHLEFTKRGASIGKPLTLCAAKVDLANTCGGHNPAVNERRVVKVGFTCGSDTELVREAWEGETLYLYCK